MYFIFGFILGSISCVINVIRILFIYELENIKIYIIHPNYFDNFLKQLKNKIINFIIMEMITFLYFWPIYLLILTCKIICKKIINNK